MNVRTSVIGGESSRRGFFGGKGSQGRTRTLVVTIMIAIALTLAFALPGFLAGVAIVLAGMVATTGAVGYSPLERARTVQRRRDARRRGVDLFEPFDPAAWAELQAARGRSGAREAGAMRQMPDGADGLGWLDMRPNRPGVAWHAPVGEPAYLSVAFEVSGQLRGLESSDALALAAAEFGRFQASLGALSSLASGIQTLTRVLPPDSALHERWVMEHLDQERLDEERAQGTDGPQWQLVRSYDELLRLMSTGALIQRHYVVVRWERSAVFDAEAARYGQGRDGWRELMSQEVESMTRRLAAARLGTVRPLTARQTAAVLRHMQNPSWPVDQVRATDPGTGRTWEIDPTNFGQAGRRLDRSHLVMAPGPDGSLETWFHRTAEIPVEAVSVQERNGLWVLPLLTGLRTPVIRTLSFNRLIVPAAEASRDARSDVTADRAERISEARSGRLEDDETETRLSAAERRRADLKPGRGNAGAQWVGHLTVSAPSEDELVKAIRLVTEACETGMGISRLRWLDEYQPAASGLTWPIARGMRPLQPSLGERFERRLMTS